MQQRARQDIERAKQFVHLSNILLALEGLQLGGKQSELLAAAVAAEGVRRNFAGFNPQALSNSAWALAKMGYGAGATPKAMEQSPWYAAAVAAAQRPGVMASAKPQYWANLLYALALVRHQPPPALLDAGAAAAMQRGNVQECANTLWALAVLQLRHAGLEAAVCGRLGELLRQGPESLTAQELCNSLWALAVLAGGGGPASPAAAALAPALAREAARRRQGFQTEELRQLWQARQELGGEVAEALARSPDLLATMEAAVAAKRATESNTSRLQEQVAEALQRLLQKGRLPIVLMQTEVVVEGVLGRVDIVADWSDGRRVAIEVDGPDHFLTNRKDNPSAVDGSTALRNRQLRRTLGEGGLVCAPYWEWYSLRTPSAQEAYLLRRLQDLLSGASSGGAAAGEGIAAAPRRQQQRTTRPQPDTAGTTTSTSTTAVSSQERRILVVRRTARKQDLQHDATCDTPSASDRAEDLEPEAALAPLLMLLQVVIDQRLAVWCERQDVMTMSAAFNLCGKLESSHAGPAATAAARAGIMAALAPALLPLVPRIRQPASCSIPLGWRRSAAATAASRLGPSSRTSARHCRTCSSRGAQLSPAAGAARAASGAGGCGEELQAVIDQRLAVWCERQDVSTMSAAFNLCGKLESSHAGGPATTAAARAGIMAALAPALLPLVPRIRQPASCSIPLWALAKAGAASDGRVESQLAPALLQRLVDPVLLDSATPQNLANALYALGKLREDQQQRGSDWDPTSSPHLIALAGAVASRLRAAEVRGFTAQGVSNSLWACAKLGYGDSDLLRPLAEATAALAPDMNAQGLVNSLWALEVLGCSGREFRAVLEALCGAALRQLQTPKETAAFKPQGLSNILLALEGLQLGGTQSERLAAAVAAECDRRLRARKEAEVFKPQELSNILLALEGLQLGGKQSERLAAAVAAEGVRRGFAGFEPQHLSNTAWALAKMGYGAGATPQAIEQRPWYAATVAAAQRPGVMAGAKPQDWANLLYALALVRHQPPPALLDAGAAAAMQRGNAQHCANTLWAQAVLQLRHAGLEAAVCGRLGELLRLDPESLVAQALCNSLWALAVLAGGGGPASPAASALAPALAREAVRRREGFQTEGLLQLWQAQQELGCEVAEALARSPDLLAAMEVAVVAERATGSTTSRLQKQVAEALQRLLQKGRLPIVSVQTEVVVEGVLGRVDIVADWSDGRRVAIEVDGPAHFPTNRKDDPSAVIGSTALRNRQLRRAFGEGGLVCVPYWEWYGLRTPTAQEAYLLQRLQDLLSGASKARKQDLQHNATFDTPSASVPGRPGAWAGRARTNSRSIIVGKLWATTGWSAATTKYR
eukprot:XP_001703086.1 predicted protein of CLR family [Chlamydomonas reinhardtii]